MFAKRLQRVDEDGAEGVDEDADDDVDDDHTRGGWSPPEAIPVWRFPPPISTGDGLLTLCLCVFDLCLCLCRGRPRGGIYSRFRSKHVRGRKIEVNQTIEGGKAPGGAARVLGLFPGSLTSWCPTLAHFVRL